MIKVTLTNEILKRISEIDENRFSLSTIELPPVTKNRLRKNSKKKSSYASNKIEGNPLTEKQASEAIDSEPHKHFLKPEQEVRNYFLALNLLEKKLKKKEFFSKEMILEVQAMVEKGAGKEKIGLRGPMPPGVLFAVYDSETGVPEYIPPEYIDIPVLLDELVEYVNTTDDHPLIIAAVVHHQLVTIQPFEEGNGRTARLMSGYILDYYGYGFNGIGSLEEYFAYDPDEYYASLQMGLPALYYSGRENPPHPEIWINYFLKMMGLCSKKVYELSKASEKDELEGSLSYLNTKEKEFLVFLLKKRLYEFTPIEVSKMIVHTYILTPMKKMWKKGISLLFSMVLIFCILGVFVGSVSRKTSAEMSESAIQNLTESLDLIKCTIEAILKNEAEFQKLIAQEIADTDNPQEYVQRYKKNQTMVKMSLILTGETEGVSNVGDTFSENELEFSLGKTVEGMAISQSYLNYMGTWAYTMKCPVIRDEKEIAVLYIEYIYDSIDKSLPKGFYDQKAMLYIMDAKSERFVLKPKGMGERSAGHLNLEDFYRANDIQTENLRQEVSECLKNGKDIMFYHNVQGKNALNYMWAVNGGSTYLVGYVPVEAIQKEGKTVNQNINTVVFTMLIAFALCCILFYVNRRQQDKIRKERDEERELYNKQLAEALQAAQVANNSKTTFLSNMSHDIRTPMNAVLGYTTLLAKDAENPDKVREYTKKILTSGRHLLSLINDILDISKIESGKVVLNFGRFAFTDLVSTVEDIVRPMSEEKHQKFSVEISGIEHKYFMGDDTRVNQILFNLLSNAVKYTPEGGNIWLRLIGLPQRTAQFEHIRIEVEDNGFGMAPAFLETIFDAFTRAENSTTNKVQGTGLGMAITKNIVELMGGTIQVFSEVDKGSLFRIELEFRISEEQAESKEECLTDINNSSLEGLHFLAAEDNEINAEILSEILEMEGADCVIVENGKLALERFKNSAAGEFDAVLMDVQMPVMNGYEATRAIRSLERRDAKTIPIIAMTANAFAEDEKDALEAGMNVHVAKPIDIEVLKRAIKQCIMGGNMS